MDDRERQPDIEARRARLVSLVAERLSPVAGRYGYSEVPLEGTIKWRPLVLVLGNYSSGKSTLINELLGVDVQATGQAPTDDSFTVITYDDAAPAGPVRVTEEREGTALLADPEYPFAGLKQHGQRFAAHFRLKKLNAPFLRNLALIDTPGMLDSMAERDRGYDYQAVVGDLAEIADLVLVLFDPHKAGTVREAHASLSKTLPAKTFEDRVLFVLNRIDECDNLPDLLRVYGTLCWNLSQMLGRKDIPPIRLTYAVRSEAAPARPEYLRFLANQRDELKHHIEQAPRYRLDHLAAYAELHGERLGHFLEALVSYRKGRRRHALKQIVVAAVLGLLTAVVIGLWCIAASVFDDPAYNWGAGAVLGLVVFLAWAFLVAPALTSAWHSGTLRHVDQLTPLLSQSRRDSWQAVQALVRKYLEDTGGKFPLKDVTRELSGIRQVTDKEIPGVRAALAEMGATRYV